MFYVKEMVKELLLAPSHFGPNIRNIVRQQLVQEMEGSSMGALGFVITIVNGGEKDSIELGTIEFDTGAVNITVHYQAILFRPFKGEVLDACVRIVTELGFFADVGPLELFVSRFAMPDDMDYDATADMWVTRDREIEIKAGCGVRVRIMNMRLDTELTAVASMKDDFLGLISAPV